jgi:hypothetical protein
MDWIQLAQIGAVAGSFEHGNDPSGFITFVECFDQPTTNSF